ncbi:hypothetical protein ACJ73_07843 [Blastomyces percursus]|uniref:Uncharacterized protein n=1 Tax=Blastomyces percursus TaxID=1658174 RepID=A0A1J9QZS2_9EURO|nr:hypothetical protein ACJ73_07843 [Blastomyces percursus]
MVPSTPAESAKRSSPMEVREFGRMLMEGYRIRTRRFFCFAQERSLGRSQAQESRCIWREFLNQRTPLKVPILTSQFALLLAWNALNVWVTWDDIPKPENPATVLTLLLKNIYMKFSKTLHCGYRGCKVFFFPLQNIIIMLQG